jgi:RNA polymerase sigma-70 factor (ECF subfamily)
MWLSRKAQPELPLDDRALVKRMRAGDEAAFEQFFEAYFQPLYRFALTRVGQEEDLAREVTQAALCKALEKLDTYRGEAALFSWLCSICRFEISAHFRRLQRQPPQVELAEDDVVLRGILESLPAGLDDPESGLLRREVARLVHVVVDHLPAHYSRILEWKYTDGLSVNEIAGRLEISPKAAESLLTRARQAFRDGFASFSPGT